MDETRSHIFSIASLFVLFVIVAQCVVVVIMRVRRIGRIKKSGLLDKKPDFCGYLFYADYFSPVMAATPGRTFPSIASSIAPPPVET